MTNIISVVNEKGGVGKTTTTVNVGAGLARLGKRILLIDLDQQGNLSDYMGYDFTGGATVSELLYAEVARQPLDYKDVIRTGSEGVDYIPSSKMLASITSILSNDNDSGTVLGRVLSQNFFQRYDYILIDNRPSLDLLVVNALTASNRVLIPVQAEKYAVDGVAGVLDTCSRLQAAQNPGLQIGGILITMADQRTNMARSVEAYLRDQFGGLVFETVIPRLTEAPNSTNEQRSLVGRRGSRLGAKYLEIAEAILNG